MFPVPLAESRCQPHGADIQAAGSGSTEGEKRTKHASPKRENRFLLRQRPTKGLPQKRRYSPPHEQVGELGNGCRNTTEHLVPADSGENHTVTVGDHDPVELLRGRSPVVERRRNNRKRAGPCEAPDFLTRTDIDVVSVLLTLHFDGGGKRDFIPSRLSRIEICDRVDT